MLTDPAIAFIEARGLSVELATRLGITSSVGSDGGSVLVFPFTVGGDVVNHKYRKLPKAGFYQDEGGQKTFWNFNAILDPTLASEPVIIQGRARRSGRWGDRCSAWACAGLMAMSFSSELLTPSAAK